MLKLLKKLFNISCLIGLHENIVVATTTRYKAEDDLRKILHEDHKWEAAAVNTLPLPVNEVLTITACPHCGHIKNNVLKYCKDRANLYAKLIGRHIKAVEIYREYYKKVQKETAYNLM